MCVYNAHQNTIALGSLWCMRPIFVDFHMADSKKKWHAADADRLKTCTFNTSTLFIHIASAHVYCAIACTHAHSQNTIYNKIICLWLTLPLHNIFISMHSHFNSSVFFLSRNFHFLFTDYYLKCTFLHKLRHQRGDRCT